MTPGPPEEPEGHLRPTTGPTLAVAAVLGLLVGGFLRPVLVGLGRTAPVVTWVQAVALVFMALVVAMVAWYTWRAIHRERRGLDPQQAVNRLVLARACALVGALAAGGYAGYAVSWLGVDAEMADERLVRSVVAAAGGVALAIASLLLERACRVPRSDDAP